MTKTYGLELRPANAQILDLESRAFLRDLRAASEHGTKTSVDILNVCQKFALNLSLTLSYGTRYVQ
jgi:hypothetical protein